MGALVSRADVEGCWVVKGTVSNIFLRFLAHHCIVGNRDGLPTRYHVSKSLTSRVPLSNSHHREGYRLIRIAIHTTSAPRAVLMISEFFLVIKGGIHW